jgi:hypothetical protein
MRRLELVGNFIAGIAIQILVLPLSVVDNSVLVFWLLLGSLSHESGILAHPSAPQSARHGPSLVRLPLVRPCFPCFSLLRSVVARAEAPAPRGHSSA